MTEPTPDLEASAGLLAAVMSATTDVVVVIDEIGTVRYVNPAASDVLGYAPAELLGRDGFALVHPDDRSFVVERAAAAWARTDEPGEAMQIRIRHASDRWIPIEAGSARRVRHTEIEGIVIVLRDLQPRLAVEQRIREAQDRLDHVESHDLLTRLPNRRQLRRYLEATAPEPGEPDGFVIAVRLCNLDEIRDRYGIEEADGIVRLLAWSLRAEVRPSDFVAFSHGAEFVIVPVPGTGWSDARTIAERARALMREPLSARRTRTDAVLSVGIAQIEPGRALDALDEAGVAARWGCSHPGQGVITFDESMRASLAETRRTVRQINEALTGDQFELHYQPIVSLGSGAVEGFEALLRWRHPERGVVAAGEFLHAVEGTATMVEIGHFVAAETAERVAWLQRTHPAPPYLAMNVSLRQLRSAGFSDELDDALDRCGADPSGLVIELTETYSVDPDGIAANEIARIRGLGVRLSLDDFGTGYSSLHHLQALRAHTLKIDRSFVSQLGADGGARAITRAAIDLAGAFRMGCVAEGIETPDQRAALMAMGCPSGQGWLFSRAVPFDDAVALLADTPFAPVDTSVRSDV
ncbi:MAG: EAL domain-containing protein [Actinomycetota bacterium]